MGRISAYFGVAASTFLVAACGSGGGGGGAAAPAMATALITSQNAPAIAAAAVGATSDSQILGDLSGLGGVGAATATVPDDGAPPTAEVTIGPDEQPCLAGGTQTVTAEIDDPQAGTSVGDSVSIVWAACNQGDGVELSGAWDFVVSMFELDPIAQTLLMEVDVTVGDVTVTEGGESITMSGDMNILLDSTNPPVSTIVVDGNLLDLTSGVETLSLSEFTVMSSVDPISGDTSFEVSGVLMSSEFDGQIVYTTTTPLDLDIDGDPTSGLMVITGADGATITVRVVSEQQVDLELDLDGDGTLDEVVVTTWDALNT